MTGHAATAILEELKNRLKGDLFTGRAQRILYATDASAYREIPLAVARPRDREDVILLVLFAREHGIPLIPRAAGTSLAGQVVGGGIEEQPALPGRNPASAPAMTSLGQCAPRTNRRAAD